MPKVLTVRDKLLRQIEKERKRITERIESLQSQLAELDNEEKRIRGDSNG